MDTNKIKAIIQMFEESQISKLDLQDGDLKLSLEKNVEVVYENIKKEITIEEKTIEEKEPIGNAVTSPLVGTYYSASDATSKPFVQVGDQVKMGDTLCIIEAMKVMNELKAPQDGTVLNIHIENGQTVEFGQTLITIG